MRIFYLITKSEIGGAQTHVYQLSKHFIGTGDEIAVMAYPGGWLELEVEKMGGKFYPNRYLSNSPNPIKALKAIREIKRTVNDFNPDLIGCHSTAAGFLGRIAIRNKIPTVFTAHGWAFTEGASFLRKYFVILTEKIAGKFCSKIICVSEFDRSLALKYQIASSDKIIVVYNGVEIQPVKIDSDCQDSQKTEAKKTKIVFVGRLAQPKDPLLLLKAFNGLSSDLKDKVQVSIIGDGPKRKELERFIGENNLEQRVSLSGTIPREKVFEFLRRSDIFVLISNWEGFPYTIIEAMSCGLAIIASDVGGVKEALNEYCGILVKRGDGGEIKNALEKLLENPSSIKKMGESARKRVEREFSLERMLKETDEVYRLE